jgi:thioredoxin 1
MEITEKNFEQEVLESEIPVMVDFWGSWCMPCKVMEPLIDELEGEYEGRVKVCKMNADRNRITPGKYNIAGVPTFILFKNGKEIGRLVGAQTIDGLRKFIDEEVK